jgi:hypothetical protein
MRDFMMTDMAHTLRRWPCRPSPRDRTAMAQVSMQRETVRLREIRGPVNAPGSLEHVRVGGESGDNSAEKLD